LDLFHELPPVSWVGVAVSKISFLDRVVLERGLFGLAQGVAYYPTLLPRHPRPSIVSIRARPNPRRFCRGSIGPRGPAWVTLPSRIVVFATTGPPFREVYMFALLLPKLF
jgi:hypothetical protein